MQGVSGKAERLHAAWSGAGGKVRKEKVMVRMDWWSNELLARVVERYRYHESMTGADNPVVADTARGMRDIGLLEMWALTQMRE